MNHLDPLRSTFLKVLFFAATMQLILEVWIPSLAWAIPGSGYQPIQPSRPSTPTGSTATRYHFGQEWCVAQRRGDRVACALHSAVGYEILELTKKLRPTASPYSDRGTRSIW